MPTDTTQFRSPHTPTPTTDREGKLRRLRTWKHWRRYGLTGAALSKRTHMNLTQVRKWAQELDFDLEGLA